MKFDCADGLGNVPPGEVGKVLAQLEREHIVLDEHDNFLSSDLVEYCAEEVEQLLRRHGYSGGALAMACKFFSGHGAVYALYEEEEMDRDAALAYLDEWVRNNRP